MSTAYNKKSVAVTLTMHHQLPCHVQYSTVHNSECLPINSSVIMNDLKVYVLIKLLFMQPHILAQAAVFFLSQSYVVKESGGKQG
jgi:hypothetical protein